MASYMEYESPLGVLLLAASANGLSGLYFEQHKYFTRDASWRRDHENVWLQKGASQLDEYFSGRRKHFDISLDLKGTVFQRGVWQELLCIPFGKTDTYRGHAAKLGNPKAVRAVGSAIGRNPISIIVPCHRVLNSAGGLAGYAGGLERKRYLLALEENHLPENG
jgi:methylated-DNA-[protein]-cysteine S-methyltransferase